MSVFPENLDTDLEIPRVDAEVSEVSGDVINALRDAVFNIQKILGLSLQGNKPDLAERIAVSIDSNGNIKSSALESIGLVTLPIDNSQISSTAVISESKLNLDFSTQSLGNAINSLTTDITSLQASFNSLSASSGNHITGLNDRHDGYQININTGTFVGVAGLSATTIGDAINEFSTLFITGDGVRPPHVNFGLPISVKHTAEFISIDALNFTTIDPTSVTIQDALDSIDEEVLGQQTSHMDDFHSNGILKEINSGEFFNPNQRKVGPVTISYTAGTTVATITGVTSFSDLGIVKGDILEIQSGVDDTGTFRIQATGPRAGTVTLGGLPELAADEVDIFHVFASTEVSATGSIYKAASVSSESAPLACSIRNNNTLVDTVTILNPDAARAVSIGFNGAILGTDGYQINIEIGLSNSQVRSLTIPDLHFERLSSSPPSVVDAQSVAERINAYVSHPTLGYHFPISAFRVGNEIAIAHNLVGSEFTLKILDGYTGNLPLGFDVYGADILDQEITGNENNTFNVNGVSRSTLRTVVDGYATITSDSTTFAIFNDDLSSVNPTNLGIRSGSVLHIMGHPGLDVNGSYTLSSASSTDVTVFAAETIPVVGLSTTFDILITDSHVSLNQLFSAETDLGIIEIFVDEDGKTLVNQRLTHGNDLGPEISIISVSDGFPPSTVTLNQSVVSGGDLRTFNIISNSVPGLIVTVDKDFIGTFKAYHPNNIDFIIIRVNSEIIGTDVANVTVDNTLNLDEAMRLCILHFDSSDSITSVIDSRHFGNIGANQIRDDFVELFSQRPVSDLRSDGIVRGFDIIDLPQIDSLTGMQALPLNGGTAYVDGVRITVETQKVIIQSFDVNRVLLNSLERIIGINNFGTIRTFDDELGEILTDGYKSSLEFGKILPLYKVTLDGNGLINQITDLRLFINNLDEKIDLIVDESNNVVGSFRSLPGALLYAGSYPGSEKLTIKIINSVEPDRALVVPDGVSIIGGAPYGGGKHKIVNTLDLNNNFITLSGNNRFENIEVVSETISLDGYLVSVNGSNVNIEKCFLRFTDPISLGSFTNGNDHAIGFESGASENVRIINNRIDNVFAGIVSTIGCDNLTITDNVLTNIVGVGIETHGIFVGSTRVLSNVDISRNTIEVPSVPASDIMGIKVGLTNTIDLVRVDSNIIKHTGGDTMTSGIHIENITVGTNKVSDLFITNNLVVGIQLNSGSIFGIYVNDVKRVNVTNNILRDIGSVANGDTAFIKIDSDVDSSKVHNNILESGDTLSGIDVGTSSNVSIVGNTIDDIGDTFVTDSSDSTVFIRGNSPGAKVSDNVLIASDSGTSPFGIYWSGAGNQTQISNNVLKAGSTSSFREYGIRVIGTDMDVSGNTITGMTSANNSIGIGSGTNGDRTKIIGNTVRGSLMTSCVEVLGGGNFSISNNLLRNIVDKTTGDGTISISIDTVTDSLIMGNTMLGVVSFGVWDNNSVVSGLTIANNRVTATTTVSIDLGTNTDNFIAGNHLPITDASVIGSSNLIGTNRGLLDIIGISIASGIPTADAVTAWDFDDTGKRWDYVTAGVIHFPLDNIPNGSRVVSVQVNGVRSTGSYTITVSKKLIASPYTVSSLGSNSFSSGTNFTEVVSTSSDVVDHGTYTYIIDVDVSGGAAGSDIIHGIFVNIRY